MILSEECGGQGFLPDNEGEDSFRLFLKFDIKIYVPEYEDFSSGPTELVDGTVEIYDFPKNDIEALEKVVKI